MKKLWVASIVILLFAGESLAEKKDVSFAAPDGFALKGAFYTSGKAGPGVLLLHQCNADHQIYDTLATMLNTAGYRSLVSTNIRRLRKTSGRDVFLSGSEDHPLGFDLFFCTGSNMGIRPWRGQG